jgi:hypothetical protein
MKRYEKQFNLGESKEGSDIYKMLGNVLNLIKKSDISNMTNQEKSSIKDKIKELSKAV